MAEHEISSIEEKSIQKDAGQDFADYARKVIKSVQEALQRSEMDSVQVLAVMIRLSNAETKEELESTIEDLKTKYPALEEVSYKEKVETEEGLDKLVQAYVSHLIKSGSVKEADAFVKAADAENVSRKSLEQAYPEFKEFLTQSE